MLPSPECTPVICNLSTLYEAEDHEFEFQTWEKWFRYLFNKADAGIQVLPASLSPFLLQGSPGWHALPPTLNLPSPGVGLPFPI